MTRDSWVWTLGILAAVLAAAANQAGLFPADWYPWINFAALIIGIVSGKLATSPLPGAVNPNKVNVSNIGKAVLLLILLPGLTGCAQSMKAKLQQADRSLAGVLQTLDTVENQIAKDGGVTPVFHKQFSGYMVTALTAGQTFHQSVMTYKPGQQPIPVDVVMLTSAMRSAADLVRSLPASDKRDKLAAIVDTVALVAQQILAIVLPPSEAALLMPSPLVYAGGH